MKSSLLGRLVLIVGAVLILLPGLVVGPSLDAATFLLAGERLAAGAVPYVDIWDHKPPGIYLADAAAAMVFGWLDSWLGAWLVTVVAIAATALLVARTLRAAGLAGTAGLAAAAALLGLGHYLLSLGGGLTEHLAVLPATASVAVVVRSVTSRAALVAGLLLGVTALISFQLVPAGAAVIALLLVRAPAHWQIVGVLLAGTLAPIAAAAALIWGIGAGPAALDALVIYSAAYREVAQSASPSLPAWTFLALLPAAVPAVLGVAALRRTQRSARHLGLASLVWIAATVAMVAFLGRFYAHYVAPMAVPLAWLAGIGLEDVRLRLGPGSVGRRVIGGAIGMALVASLAVAVAGGEMEARQILRARQASADAARLVSDEAPPGSEIWVWGNAPWLYLDAERAPATRYVYLYPMTTPGYVTPALVSDLLASLQESPPALVIDAGSPRSGEPGFLPLLIHRPVATDGRDADLLDPLRRFVRDRYERLRGPGGWPVYRLADGR